MGNNPHRAISGMNHGKALVMQNRPRSRADIRFNGPRFQDTHLIPFGNRVIAPGNGAPAWISRMTVSVDCIQSIVISVSLGLPYYVRPLRSCGHRATLSSANKSNTVTT